MMQTTREILLGIVDRAAQGITPTDNEAAALRRAVEVLDELVTFIRIPGGVDGITPPLVDDDGS